MIFEYVPNILQINIIMWFGLGFRKFYVGVFKFLDEHPFPSTRKPFC